MNKIDEVFLENAIQEIEWALDDMRNAAEIMNAGNPETYVEADILFAKAQATVSYFISEIGSEGIKIADDYGE